MITFNATILPGETYTIVFPTSGTQFNLSCITGVFTDLNNQTLDPSRYEVLLTKPVVSPWNNDNSFNIKKIINSGRGQLFSSPPSLWSILVTSQSDTPLEFALALQHKILNSMPGTSYDPNLVYRLLKLSSAAYLDNPAECDLLKGFRNFSMELAFAEDMPIVHNINAKIFGFIGVDWFSKQIIVTFRGTPGSTIVGVFQFLQEVLSSSLVDIQGVRNGEKMSEYFLKAAEAVLFTNQTNAFQKKLIQLTRELPDFQVVFTGHSLGGALASATAFMTTLANQHRIKRTFLFGTERISKGLLHGFPENRIPLVYTFGEPRIGNYFFAKTYNELIPFSFRISHGEDVAPHFPKCLLDQGCGSGPAPGPFREGVLVHYYDNDFQNPTFCLPEFCKDRPVCTYWPTFNNPCAADHSVYFGLYVGRGCLVGSS